MIPTPTPIPFDFEPAIQAEFVSWPLLIFQLFLVGCVTFTLVYLYMRLKQWSSDELSEHEMEMRKKDKEISDLRVQIHNAEKAIAVTGSMRGAPRKKAFA